MLIQADATNIPLPDKSAHCVMTSPPYYGLRKYAGEQGRIWGGDPECVHEWGDEVGRTGFSKGGSNKQNSNPGSVSWEASQGQFCQLCGAWYGGLGLEPTPELHIKNIVEIFREIKRVLRDDGVVWLNYGDCYAGGGGKSAPNNQEHIEDDRWAGFRDARYLNQAVRKKDMLPQGNLMLMPHRVAIALQDDGWIVRNDLIWFKRNPMPESVAGWSYQFDAISAQKKRNKERIKRGKESKPILDGFHFLIPKWLGEEIYQYFFEIYGEGGYVIMSRDSWRHTRAHEYIFQLVKNMGYYCNQEAVRETASEASLVRINQDNFENQMGGEKDYRITGVNPNRSMRQTLENFAKNPGRNPRSVLKATEQRYYELPDGTICIVSEDCPIHGHRQGVQIQQMEFDGGPAIFSLSHNEDTDDDHDPESASEPLSNSDHSNQEHRHPTKDSPNLENGPGHNPENTDANKKVMSHSDACGEGVQIPYDNENNQELSTFPSEDGLLDSGDHAARDRSISDHKKSALLSEPDMASGLEVLRHTDRNESVCSCNWIIPQTHYASSVLDVPTVPYSGAHYATFPPNLIAPLIRASCPRRSCPECGQAWAPVVEKTNEIIALGGAKKQDIAIERHEKRNNIFSYNQKVLDYRPTCSHDHDPIPGIVLDPFIGSGTTGAVASELQRRWIGLDISMDYIDQQAKVRALKWTPSNALDQLPLFKRETADD